MTKNLSINRINQLIIRFLVYNYKSTILFYSVFGIIMLFFFFLFNTSGKVIDYEKQFNFFFFWYFLIGLYSSSRAFKEMHNPGKAYQYLTLPVSNIERFISTMIVYYLLYLIIGILLYLIISFLANSLTISIINLPQINKFINISPLKFVKISEFYLWIVSIFMAGSISFKKHPFLKTLFALIIFFILIMITSALIFKAIFYNFDFRLNNWVFKDYNFFDLKYSFYKNIGIVISIIYLIFIWMFTYFKIQEKQI